jgi:hypothetical protein
MVGCGETMVIYGLSYFELEELEQQRQEALQKEQQLQQRLEQCKEESLGPWT